MTERTEATALLPSNVASFTRNVQTNLGEKTMRTWSKFAAAVTAGCLGVTIAGTAVKAAEIALMTTAAVEQIMKGLIPSFERASGHKVNMTVLGTGPAVAKIIEGTFADLILLGPPALNELARAGKVDAATITPAFHSRIGMAVRAGAKKPDISTSDALKKALLDAKSIGYSIGPSGEHFSKVVVVKLGIADELRPRMKNVRGMPVGMGAAKGEVEIAIHQIAELMPVPGIDIVGDLPAELNTTIIYATALTTMVQQPEAAKALVQYLRQQSSVPVIKKNGMDPA
jgi:molybdate transport system substrate-binding protein